MEVSMRIIENTTLYVCEHCKKIYRSKRHCEKHEVWCSRNPANRRACNTCVYAQQVTKEIEIADEYGTHKELTMALYCNKQDMYLMPLKVERKGNAFHFKDKKNVPMPKECQYYQA